MSRDARSEGMSDAVGIAVSVDVARSVDGVGVAKGVGWGARLPARWYPDCPGHGDVLLEGECLLLEGEYMLAA